MSIISFVSYTDRLTAMREALATAKQGQAGSGWNTARTMTPTKASVPAMPRNVRHAGGSKLIQTVELASEVSFETGSQQGGAIAMENGTWRDKQGMTHALNPDLENVHEILLKMMDVIFQDKSSSQHLEQYLIHVNDLELSAAMTRPTTNNYSHLGSQMSIITPQGLVYNLAMDRVRTGVGSSRKYAWHAVLVPQSHEMGMMVATADQGVQPLEPTGHLKIGETAHLAYYRQAFDECVFNDSSALKSYVTRETIPLALSAPGKPALVKRVV